MDLGELLTFAKQCGASDLHLSAGAVPMVRVNGDMRKIEVEGDDLSTSDRLRDLIGAMLTPTQRERLESDWELDCAITFGAHERFRANVFLQERGISAVIRVIPSDIRSPEELGLPPIIREIAGLENGLVLVTGPTGSGKSTTLAALIDHINKNRRGHIITIEDPIEFVHRQKNCMVNQREVGAHTKAFSNALRSALREDPDVILVGEMRDHETISLALTAAETGHLVFGTLHTSSAPRTIERIINVFPPEEQLQVREMLANSIQAIIAQVLVKKKTGGRTAAHEILIATDAARSMIRDGKGFQLASVIQTGARNGMQSLEQSLDRLVTAGIVERKLADETVHRLQGGWTEDGASRPAAPIVRKPDESGGQPGHSTGPAAVAGAATPGRQAGIVPPKPQPQPTLARPRGEPVLVLDSGPAPAPAPPAKPQTAPTIRAIDPDATNPPGRHTPPTPPPPPPPPPPPGYSTPARGSTGPRAVAPADPRAPSATPHQQIDAMVSRVQELRKKQQGSGGPGSPAGPGTPGGPGGPAKPDA